MDDPSRLKPAPWRVALGFVLGLGALGVAFWVPTWASSALMRTVTDFFKLAALASAWNLIGGYTGYPSFGNVAFFGLGAYATGLAMVQFQWPFAAALVFAALLCLLLGLLLGLPVLRLKGHYFAIATLGAAEGLREIIRNLEIVEANRGLVMPLIYDPPLFYFLTLGLLALTLGLTWVITKTRFGYGLIAIREDEEAAAVLGINTRLYKTTAFCLSGILTGLVGGVHAYHITFIDPQAAFDVLRTISMIVMAVIGGAGTVFGPLIGVVLIFSTSEYLASLSAQLRTLPVIFFGGMIVLITLFLPSGLWDLLSGRQRLSWRYLLENIRMHRA
ncbi:MAG: branched-chain amino acid ABC transporter permease [Candidatus Bipolaricaulia bacterium]